MLITSTCDRSQAFADVCPLHVEKASTELERVVDKKEKRRPKRWHGGGIPFQRPRSPMAANVLSLQIPAIRT